MTENQSTIKLHPSLAAHLRWMVVLARLKELDGYSQTQELKKKKESPKIKPVKELVSELGLDSLFLEPESCNLVITQENWWNDWFSGGKSYNRTLEPLSPFNSVYQCRQFYALNAPNNLVASFTKRLEASSADSKYDKYIEQWGDYALNLVECNGGWESFLQKESLDKVFDYWKGQNDALKNKTESDPIKASDPDSLIQRILFLERDRYIQVLTASVGVLWPLWFLKRHDFRKTLVSITNQENENFRLGKPLPEHGLFIDINTEIGRFEDLPYPFNVADRFLKDILGKDEYQNFLSSSWSSDLLFLLTQKLKDEYWSPPLLFAVRGDQFQRPDDSSKNYPIPFISISNTCDIFPSYFLRKSSNDSKKEYSDFVYGIEEKTYGEVIINKLKQKLENIKEDKIELMSRQKMPNAFNNSEIDLIFSYYPVDLLLEVSEEFIQLSNFDIYKRFGKYGEAFNYSVPNIVLAGGMYLVNQPQAQKLIVDFAVYLQKTEMLFRHLQPNLNDLESQLKKLDHSSLESKKDAANFVAFGCQSAAGKSKLVDANIISSDILKQWLIAIGEDMIKNLVNHDNDLRQNFSQNLQDWGWVRLLEYLRYTAIFISCDLFGGVK